MFFSVQQIDFPAQQTIMEFSSEQYFFGSCSSVVGTLLDTTVGSVGLDNLFERLKPAVSNCEFRLFLRLEFPSGFSASGFIDRTPFELLFSFMIRELLGG